MRRGHSKAAWSRGADNAAGYADWELRPGGMVVDNVPGSADWELRPGGMVVQLRDPIASAALVGPMIKVKVSYRSSVHEVSIAAHSTFGELKKILVQDTGLHPKQQRLLYKGKEKDSRDYLRDAGVKEKSKIVLVEDTARWEKRLVELRKDEALAKASKAVEDAKKETDKLAAQIPTMEAAVVGGKKLADDQFTGLSDKLMWLLVKLDDVKAEGDAQMQRKILVGRLQKCLEGLDALKIQNDKLNHHDSSVTNATWLTFDGTDILTGGPTSTSVNSMDILTGGPPSTSVNSMADWELFD